MGLADDLTAVPGPLLRASELLEKLPDEDAAALKAALLDPHMPINRIVGACRRNGIVLSDTAVRTWRTHNGVS
jgi:hypothetical protein